jgi:hypothetical protein
MSVKAPAAGSTTFRVVLEFVGVDQRISAPLPLSVRYVFVCRLLVLFRNDPAGRIPEVVQSMALGAASAGPRVRMHAYETSGLRAAMWADAVAFGIDDGDRGAPGEVKHWLDRLGFGGWQHLRAKPAWVFATRAPVGRPSTACDRVADILRRRGMDAVTPSDREAFDHDPDAAAAALGTACAENCMGRSGGASGQTSAPHGTLPALPGASSSRSRRRAGRRAGA